MYQKLTCAFLKSYKHCVLIRRQFQLSQEHSNLKEVSQFVLWYIKKKITLMIPIKRCECHFYISLPVSGQQAWGSKQSHNNLPEIKDFRNIWSGTQVCHKNCACLLVFSIRDYIIYRLFLCILTFYKTKEEKCTIRVPLILSDVLLSSHCSSWVKP